MEKDIYLSWCRHFVQSFQAKFYLWRFVSPKLHCVGHFVYGSFIVLECVELESRDDHTKFTLVDYLISRLYVASIVCRTQQRISCLMLFHKSGLIVNLVFLKVKSREGRYNNGNYFSHLYVSLRIGNLCCLRLNYLKKKKKNREKKEKKKKENQNRIKSRLSQFLFLQQKM